MQGLQGEQGVVERAQPRAGRRPPRAGRGSPRARPCRRRRRRARAPRRPPPPRPGRSGPRARRTPRTTTPRGRAARPPGRAASAGASGAPQRVGADGLDRLVQADQAGDELGVAGDAPCRRRRSGPASAGRRVRPWARAARAIAAATTSSPPRCRCPSRRCRGSSIITRPPAQPRVGASAPRAQSMWRSSWVAITVRRMRAVPTGTEGGRMAGAQTPRRRAARRPPPGRRRPRR